MLQIHWVPLIPPRRLLIWLMQPELWFTLTLFNMRRMARLMFRNWIAIFLFLLPINFLALIPVFYMENMTFWKNFLLTKFVRQPINFLENSRLVLRTMKVLLGC